MLVLYYVVITADTTKNKLNNSSSLKDSSCIFPLELYLNNPESRSVLWITAHMVDCSLQVSSKRIYSYLLYKPVEMQYIIMKPAKYLEQLT